MRRKIVYFLLTLTVLFAGIVGVAWYLLENESFLKSQLGKYALKYTGRELRFDGPLVFNLGATTTLEGRDIHFANAGWSEHRDMVSVGRIFISFQLSTLFGDRPVFPDAQLEDCRVYVERNDSGELNWDIGPPAAPEHEPDTATEPEEDEPGRKSLPIWVKNLVVRNCEAHVSSFKIETPLHLELTSVDMQHLDDTRWSGKGSGSLNDLPLFFDGWFAPFSSVIYGGPVEQELRFTLGQISLESSGTLQDVKTGTGANLSARLQGPEIENILNEFKLPLFTEGDFDFTLMLNTEGAMTRIDLDGDLGSLQASVNGELDRLVGPSRGEVKVEVDGPNLGALAKILGVEGLVEEAFSHQSHATIDGDRIHFKTGSLKTSSDHLQFGGHFSLPNGFAGTELDVAFQTDEIGRWTVALDRGEHDLGSLDLDTKLRIDDQGLIRIEGRVTQEATTLDVNGALGRLPDAIRPDLEFSLDSANPRPLASVWGLTRIPEDRLTARGRLGLEGKRLYLGKVDIGIASSSANIDGVLNLGDRLAGSDVTVALDIANAEKLGQLFGREGLPNQPLQLKAEIRPDGEGLAFKVNDGNLGDIQVDLDARIPDLQQPMGISGTFDIDLPRLGDVSFLVPGVDLPDAPFTANGELLTEKGRVNLRGVKVDLAGNLATIDGHVNMGERYAGSQLSFVLDIKNAHELGLLFGVPDLPDQPVKLSASVEPAGKGLAFNINEGTMGDIKLDLDGRILDLEQPTGIDAAFDLQLGRFSDISFLAPKREFPAVPFTASGRLVNEKTRTRLDKVQLSLGDIKASVDGELRPDNSFQLAVNAAGPDASALDLLAATELPAKPFAVSGSLLGNPSEFQLRDAQVTLGESRARGNLNIGLGDITVLHGNIVSPYTDASHWYPGEAADEEQADQSDTGTREWMFDETPVAVLRDHKLDIDLKLDIETLVLGNTTVKSIDLNFLLTDGLLKLSPFTLAGIEGGSYNGSFILDGTSGTPRLHVDATGKNVRVGLMASPEQDPQTYPPIEIEANLSGAGASYREMASSLDGKLRIYQGSGQLARSGMDLLFSDFLTQLITQLNPFAKVSEYTELECSVFAADFRSGMIEAFPLIVQTKQLTILSEGTIDLNTEKINLSFNTKPRTGLGLSPGMVINPLIKVGGRLTAPTTEIDPAGTLTSGGLAVATVGVSLLVKSMSDRFFSSPDPCGEARRELAKKDAGTN